MLPRSKILEQPISLRNPYIFYLGHIPTFLDIHLSQATGQAGVFPEDYRLIFERGVDPDVNDPLQCHYHSDIPEQWPALEQILEFSSCVRAQVESLYKNEEQKLNTSTRLRKALWMSFEHEAMHLETFLYMLLQDSCTRIGHEVVKPSWLIPESQLPKANLCNNTWIEIPQTTISIGIDDTDDECGQGPELYSWDNEKPRRSGINIPQFQAKGAPLCIEDYVDYLASKDALHGPVPATWVPAVGLTPLKDVTRKERILNSFSLRTFFGPLPLSNPYARALPVVASYDELLRCAQWFGGRIPTQGELLSIYEYKDQYNTSPENPARAIPTKVHEPLTNGWSRREIGFKHWMWSSVRAPKEVICGRGETGGAWEWTSTVLDRHQGFREQAEYPGYTGKS